MNRRKFITRMTEGAAGAALGLEFATEANSVNHSNIILDIKQARNEKEFWQLVRSCFPLSKEKTYFNNGGLGPSPYSVIETMHHETIKLETEGEHGHQLIHQVNEKAARLLNVETAEVAITRNTTEGMNIIARGLSLRKGDEVLLSTHEHVGGTIPWLALAQDIGIKINLFEPGKNQAENLNIIEQHITPKTRVLSISHITCTTGLIFPAKEIGQLCRDRDIIYVLDGAHPPGMIPLNLPETGCDFYAASGHKWLLGPKGTGLLYINKNIYDRWHPTYVGAYSDAGTYNIDKLSYQYKTEANATEYGTRNAAVALGLGAAIDFITTIGQERIAVRGKAMATYFRNRLKEEMPDIEILTPDDEDSYASIITFKSKKMPYSELQHKISEQKNIRLRGVGEHQLNAIRCSCHVYNNFADLDLLVETMKNILST